MKTMLLLGSVAALLACGPQNEREEDNNDLVPDTAQGAVGFSPDTAALKGAAGLDTSLARTRRDTGATKKRPPTGGERDSAHEPILEADEKTGKIRPVKKKKP